MRNFLIVMLGCLFTAGAKAGAVIEELSRRSHIPAAELTEILQDCERYQRNMNICAFYSFVEVDLELQKLVEERLPKLPASCHAKFRKKQAEWEKRRDRKCSREADDEAEGGSMRPMIYSGCRTEATTSRIEYLQAVERCADVR